MVKFSDLIHVLRRLDGRALTGSTVSGMLTIDSDETLRCLQECDGAWETTAIDLGDRDITSVKLGDRLEVAFDTPRPNFGLVRQNLDALLAVPSARVFEPQNYYLLEEDHAQSDVAKDDSAIARYRKVLELIQMLKICAAFLDEHQAALVFFREGKFELPLLYSASDLTSMSAADLEGLLLSIPPGVHKAEIEALLAEAIFEVTSPLAAPLRFGHLLSHLGAAREKLTRAYRLYAAGFSYEKIKSEVEAARIEFTGKIHKVFSDIQNQLLGIPVATIIVATQMKPHSSVTADFWISAAVLAGSFVFALLVHFLLRNQKHTLEVVGMEIERQEAEVREQPDEVASSFASTFRLLHERYKAQQRILTAIDWILMGGVLLSIFFFYQVSEPTRAWFASLFM